MKTGPTSIPDSRKPHQSQPARLGDPTPAANRKETGLKSPQQSDDMSHTRPRSAGHQGILGLFNRHLLRGYYF